MNYKFTKIKDEDNSQFERINKLTDLLKQSLNQIGINDIISIISKRDEDGFDLCIKVILKEKCSFERDKLIELLYKTPFSHQTTEKDIYYWDSTYFDDEGTNKIISFGLEKYDKYDYDDYDDNDGNGYFDDDDNWYPDYETYSDYNDSKPIKDSFVTKDNKIKDTILTYEDIEDNIVKNKNELINLLKQSLTDLGMKVINVKEEQFGENWETELFIYVRLADVCIPEYKEEYVDELYENILNSPFGKFCKSSNYVKWEDFWIKDGSKRKVLGFGVFINPNYEDFKEDSPNFTGDSKQVKDSFMTKDEINKRLSNEISKDLTFDSYDIYASKDEFDLELCFKYKNKYDIKFDVEGEVTDTFKEDYGEGVEYKINIIDYDYVNDIPDEEIDNIEKILKKLEKSVLLDDIIKMCDEDIQREVLERIDENNHNFEEEMKSYRDSKQVNDNVISLLNQLQSSLKGAYNLASGLKQQLPQQQPTTNEEKALYNGKFITSLENIADNVSRWYKEIEGYKKEFAKAHIVIEEVIESFPLEARTKLRESEDPEQTYKELVEDLKNRYNSLPEKEKYKEQALKMKKDLDGFYKNTFKK